MRGDRVRAVLLDMGEVLIPVRGYRGAASDPDVLAALRRLGVEAPESAVLDAAQRVASAYDALRAECSQPDLDAVLAGFSPSVRRVLLGAFRRQASPRPFDHARGVVAELARSFRLGLVSNNVLPGDHHARLLARNGILHHLDVAVWSANFGRRKPDPAMIEHALARLGLPPRAAVLVGDKLSTDVLAARRAGVRSIYLRKRGAPLEGPVRPDFTVGDLRAVPALVRSL